MFRVILLVIIVVMLTTTVSYAHVQNIYMSIAPNDIEYHLEDSNGLITGYTPNGILNQIRGIPEYYYRAAEDLGIDDQPKPYEKFHLLRGSGVPNFIISGKYKVVIYGANTAILSHFSLDIRWNENIYNKISYTNNQLLIYPNTVWIYEFDIPVVPPVNQQIILTKISTPTDLIKDLTTAGQLNYIGNPKFVSELTKEINEIEAERSKVDPSHSSGDDGLTPAQKAKKDYTELLKEITEKYNKPEADEFVKQEAYTVLREDLEYIISHL